MKLIYLHFILFIFCTNVLNAQSIQNNEINNFVKKTGAVVKKNKATNNPNFIKFKPGKALFVVGTTPEEKVLEFLKENKKLFANSTNTITHHIKKSDKDNFGFYHVTAQQNYKGIPVFDGILKFHFDKNLNISTINGNNINIEKINEKPTITAKEAEDLAIKIVEGQKLGTFSTPIKTNKSTLYLFQKGLAQGFEGTKHLVYEVEVNNENDIREFLYIDAHTKELVEQFTGIHEVGLNRKLYEKSISNPNLRWSEGDAFPGALDIWQQSEVETAGNIYNMMKNAFGFVSYNNADASMITINNNPNISCPNANWNGTTANYCTGVATDDVVAHEWGHAYTEYTSNLIYEWQAGALNESYSDIWGETVDQINSYFDASTVSPFTPESNALRTACNSSSRWLMGEQSTAFGGAIRDMWDPTCKGDPGKVTDSQYWCVVGDAGGVHTNSGVQNHAYALLVDGGTYNGQTINGLGLTKAAHIFWYAQANFMTQTTDFASQADNLEASLQALKGINLPALSTSASSPVLSGQIITDADALELEKVILAVELRTSPNCGFQTILKPVAPICIGGSLTNAIYYEDFEDGLTGWSVSNSGGGASWISHNWTSTINPPAGRIGSVAFGINDNGNCTTFDGFGLITLSSPSITIPANTAGPFNLTFDHYVATEGLWDGGNLEYSIGGAAFSTVPIDAFTTNGYNATLYNTAQGNNNPLQGKFAFTGTDDGSLTGSWGQSSIDLGKLGLLQTASNQTIKFRWNLGQDGCTGIDGWYIDDIKVYSCAQPTVQFEASTTFVNEAEATIAGASPNQCLNYVEKTVVVKINKAPSQPVTVTLNTPTGTATQGSTLDYTISPTSFILESGTLSKNVIVRIYDDAYVEGKENIVLTYTLNPGTGDAITEATNQTHTITITDNDINPETFSAELINENFNLGEIPSGWSVIGGGLYPTAWAVKSYLDSWLDPNGHPFLFINSNDLGNQLIDKIIETPPFNTLGMATINLSFIEYFKIYNGAGDLADEQAIVEVWDGANWQNLLTETETTGTKGSFTAPFTRNIPIPITYANAAMKVRFRYIANSDNWWAIDNVKVAGTMINKIESVVTANPDPQYLGPNGTANFYDAATGNIILKIKNLTSHDYGCTSVVIDRAGNGQTNWFGGHLITNKTFKVTPSTNNGTGQYEITLYYTAAEVTGITVNSMGKSTNNIPTSSTGVFNSVIRSAAYTTDFAFTSTFNNGFSGFGLSDAQVITIPLPVQLIKFEGKNTPEGNKLEWLTASETNNNYFIIEKATNTNTYLEIGKVKGSENTSEVRNYTYLDKNYSKGLNYYRLKQIDNDGQYHYSKTISILASDEKIITISPNPVHSTLYISLPENNSEIIEMKMINTSGVEIFDKMIKIKDGKIIQDVSKLPTGLYQIILITKANEISLKMIKE